MKIVAINTSPRTNWNTAMLVKEAAKGAEEKGAQVRYFDLYRQEKFTGCISCFGCKREPNEGTCIYKDGIYEILQAIREADAVIIGTPNYLGHPSAGFMALFERLIFQNITYRTEKQFYKEANTPVLFIMTSNSPAESYLPGGYNERLAQIYPPGLTRAFGPVKTLYVGNTLQVSDYSKYNWTMFDPAARKERRENVFPTELRRAYEMGAELVK